MLFHSKPTAIPSAEEAIKGTTEKMAVTNQHFVNGTPIQSPFPDGLESAVFGLGCFWGAERIFWQTPGVYTTAVGYAGGHTNNPTYSDICTGMTGHTEAVLVVFDPAVVDYASLVKLFFESHDPTQGMRQGNDRGTQYRSAIYTFNDEQHAVARDIMSRYEQMLGQSGYPPITTELESAPTFF